MTTTWNAKLVRLCCDDELTPEQAAQIEQLKCQCPEACEQFEKQTDFERRLRQRIGCVMAADASSAPPELAQCICECLHSGSNAADQPSAVIGRVDAASSRPTKTRSWFAALFASPTSANVFAVAASIALIAAAVLFGIYGPSINDRPRGPSVDLAAVAAFVDQEHGRCAGSDATLEEKAVFKSVADAQQHLSEWIGVPVTVFDLEPLGYQFAGAGPCRIPVQERSAHLIYRRSNWQGEPVPKVSVFLVPVRGDGQRLCEQTKRWFRTEGGKNCEHTVMRSSDGRLVYLVVCCVDQDLQNVTGRMSLASFGGAR